MPRNSLVKTFGRELTLINADTHIALQDPIQEDIWKNNHFSLAVRDCFLMLENNKPLQGLEYEDCPKTIRVPANESGILETKAFHSTARVRHAWLDVGFCTVCPQAWRCCHSLRMVKLPDTATVIGYAAFQSYSLQVVFFFHEYGRRVGGVPRSSLKGKETQHDEGEKNTSKPQKANKNQPKQEPQTNTTKRPEAESPSSNSVSSVRR